MEKIVGVFVKAPQTRAQNDDDFADRLSSRYTVVLLVAFSLLVGFTQYVRTPITCWAPVHFEGSHVKFTNNYCWVKNTYYLPWDQLVPEEDEPRQMIPYYQWIPFILLSQALLFFLPSVVWHGLNSKAGVDADNIMAASHTFSRTDRVEHRERTLKMVVNQVDRFLRSRQSRPTRTKGACCFDCVTSCRGSCQRRNGCYLVVLYLISKVFYIGNAVGQLFLLSKVLSNRYSTFGADLVRSMVDNVDWTEDSYVAFPRVTLCDFKVRGQDMANVHRYTVQCVLPINMYNEKIYVFFWFWLIFVASVSGLSFIVWFLRSVIPVDRLRFVQTHIAGRLKELPSRDVDSKTALKDFTNNYLQIDGVFLLRLIAHNTNGITTTEVASAVFDQWIETWASEKNQPSAPEKEDDTSESTMCTEKTGRSGRSIYSDDVISE